MFSTPANALASISGSLLACKSMRVNVMNIEYIYIYIGWLVCLSPLFGMIQVKATRVWFIYTCLPHLAMDFFLRRLLFPFVLLFDHHEELIRTVVNVLPSPIKRYCHGAYRVCTLSFLRRRIQPIATKKRRRHEFVLLRILGWETTGESLLQ